MHACKHIHVYMCSSPFYFGFFYTEVILYVNPSHCFSCLSSVTQSMDLYNFVFHILTDKALSLPLRSLSLDAQH